MSKSREWNSTAYHRLSRPQVGWGQKLLARVQVRGDETVMDAGCGTGRLTGELLERLPAGRVIAVDLSENMLRTAREHLLPRFAGRVFFVCADLQELPFCEVLDGIFSTAAFHWAPDHERLFRNLYRALKPGGWLVAQCGGGPNLACLLQRVAVITSCREFAEFFAGWRNPCEYADDITTARRLRRAGFLEVETSLEQSPAVLSGAEEFRDYLATVTLHRHLGRIPDPRLRERFLDELAQHAAQDDPPFRMDYVRLNLSGRRPPA